MLSMIGLATPLLNVVDFTEPFVASRSLSAFRQYCQSSSKMILPSYKPSDQSHSPEYRPCQGMPLRGSSFRLVFIALSRLSDAALTQQRGDHTLDVPGPAGTVSRIAPGPSIARQARMSTISKSSSKSGR